MKFLTMVPSEVHLHKILNTTRTECFYHTKSHKLEIGEAVQKNCLAALLLLFGVARKLQHHLILF